MRLACIKIGGATMDADGFYTEFAAALAACRDLCAPVVVHGGGKDIARELERLNKEFTFVEGLRVTDAQTLNTVQMVLSGSVNKRLVAAILGAGVRAVGISGVDGGLLVAKKTFVGGHDIGFVGEVHRVDTALVETLAGAGFVPVVSPVSRGDDGEIYNVNADTAAAELAVALHADDLLFVSDVPGVRVSGQTRHHIGINEIESLVAAGEVRGGMIPKLRSAAAAVARGVGRVHICGWTGRESIAAQLQGSGEAGTIVGS